MAIGLSEKPQPRQATPAKPLLLDVRARVGEKVHQGIFWGRRERMSGLFASAKPYRIKAAHRRRRKVALGPIVQRYYDPSIGRFLSVDPVAARESGDNFNRYAYASNNPYRFKDPDGRETGAGYTNGEYTMAQPSPEGLGLVADFIPVIGDIKGAIEAFQDPTPVNIAAAVVGLVPEVGDVAGKALKIAEKGAAGGERAGKVFTRAGKTEVKETNAAANGGKTACANCGQATVPAQQSRAGVTPPKNETHVDHVIPKSQGGNGSPNNGQVLCRECNLEKGAK